MCASVVKAPSEYEVRTLQITWKRFCAQCHVFEKKVQRHTKHFRSYTSAFELPSVYGNLNISFNIRENSSLKNMAKFMLHNVEVKAERKYEVAF
jgi:hypothetical protein